MIWPQLIGYARAKEYLLTGDLMTAQQAAQMGLINHAVPADELDARVDAFADRLAAGATKAIRWTKMSVNIGLRDLATSIMDASLAYEALSNITPDHAGGGARLRREAAAGVRAVGMNFDESETSSRAAPVARAVRRARDAAQRRAATGTRTIISRARCTGSSPISACSA